MRWAVSMRGQVCLQAEAPFWWMTREEEKWGVRRKQKNKEEGSEYPGWCRVGCFCVGDEQEWMEKRQEKKEGEEERIQSDEFSFWFSVCSCCKSLGRLTELRCTVKLTALIDKYRQTEQERCLLQPATLSLCASKENHFTFSGVFFSCHIYETVNFYIKSLLCRVDLELGAFRKSLDPLHGLQIHCKVFRAFIKSTDSW